MMSMPSVTALALIAVAGGVGAVLRFGVDALAKRRNGTATFGIFTVNVIASALIGAAAALGLVAGDAALSAAQNATDNVASAALQVPPDVAHALVAGLLGGFSTFSTVAVDSARLLRRRQWVWLLVNTAGMFAVSVAAYFGASFVATSILGTFGGTVAGTVAGTGG